MTRINARLDKAGQTWTLDTPDGFTMEKPGTQPSHPPIAFLAQKLDATAFYRNGEHTNTYLTVSGHRFKKNGERSTTIASSSWLFDDAPQWAREIASDFHVEALTAFTTVEALAGGQP